MKKKKVMPRVRVSAEKLVSDMIANCGIYETKHAIESINRKFKEFSYEDVPKLPDSFTLPVPKTEFGTKIYRRNDFDSLRRMYADALGLVTKRVARLRESTSASTSTN